MQVKLQVDPRHQGRATGKHLQGILQVDHRKQGSAKDNKLHVSLHHLLVKLHHLQVQGEPRKQQPGSPQQIWELCDTVFQNNKLKNLFNFVTVVMQQQQTSVSAYFSFLEIRMCSGKDRRGAWWAGAPLAKKNCSVNFLKYPAIFFFTVISRVATILKTRYTSPGFWTAGLGLFLEAEQLVSESSEKNHLHTCIVRAQEQLSEIDNQPDESTQNRRNQGYLFEGHLTVDQEPPQPQWLVQSNLMTALAASMSQAQTSTDGATDGSNSLPQELLDRIHELVPNITDDSNNLPQEMIDRLVAMFPEGDSVAKAPPASKEVVAKLPVITITDEILGKLGPDAECAICKENLLVQDKMQEMPNGARNFYWGARIFWDSNNV
nr:hypothetical protein [Tanacetum cinerariifolium]